MKTISKPIYNLRTLYWPTTLFLLGLPLLALILTPIYFALQIPSWGILISAIVYMFFSIFVSRQVTIDIIHTELFKQNLGCSGFG